MHVAARSTQRQRAPICKYGRKFHPPTRLHGGFTVPVEQKPGLAPSSEGRRKEEDILHGHVCSHDAFLAESRLSHDWMLYTKINGQMNMCVA